MTMDSDLRQSVLDAEHLRLLGLGYLLSAIMSAVFSLMGLFYALMGAVITSSANAMPASANQPPPELFAWIFGIFGIGFFVVMITAAVLKFLTYRFLKERRNRIFCLVIAGFSCLELPYGTALGVCTFLVMNRRSVEELFRSAPPIPAP
jgi:hypothetical protein